VKLAYPRAIFAGLTCFPCFVNDRGAGFASGASYRSADPLIPRTAPLLPKVPRLQIDRPPVRSAGGTRRMIPRDRERRCRTIRIDVPRPLPFVIRQLCKRRASTITNLFTGACWGGETLCRCGDGVCGGGPWRVRPRMDEGRKRTLAVVAAIFRCRSSRRWKATVTGTPSRLYGFDSNC